MRPVAPLIFSALLTAACTEGVIVAPPGSSVDPIDVPGNPLDPKDPAKPTSRCVDRTAASPTKTLTLSKPQLHNALEDLFGADVVLAVEAPLSTVTDESHHPETFNRLSVVSPALVSAWFNVAKALSNEVLSKPALRARVFGACAMGTAPAATCVDTYLSTFAPKLLRRPLTPDEVAFAKSLVARPGDKLENLRAVLTAHLFSPSFLWRQELGSADPTDGRVALTPYEVAARLSFSLTDTTPDDTLLAAAAAGELATPDGIRAQAQRLVDTPRGRTKTVELLARWARTTTPTDFSGLPGEMLAAVQTDGLAEAMGLEAKAFVDDTVYVKRGSFKALLTSKASFASHPGLANIYGHAAVAGGVAQTFPDRRQGLLMRAGYLTHSLPRTSIIHRGVDFQKYFLCNTIPAPTVDIVDNRDADALTVEQQLASTNRESVAHQTKSAVCQACHKVINPTGNAFESFDALGRYRTEERIYDANGMFVRTLPVDSRADVPLPDGTALSVGDAYDLVTWLSTSKTGASCFSTNLYRLLNEKLETNADACELEDLEQVVSSPDRAVVDAIARVAANTHAATKFIGGE
ncbi:MAG: DUF1592 domain-containing protein [Myxococcaceae bacterium]|nr:DUF1592 domain-containing protein [Myxococcaceae bacterium]